MLKEIIVLRMCCAKFLLRSIVCNDSLYLTLKFYERINTLYSEVYLKATYCFHFVGTIEDIWFHCKSSLLMYRNQNRSS